MCLNPIKIVNSGKYKQTTYKGNKGEEYEIEVYAKCGHCQQCTNEKSNNWAIRNYYESKVYKDICFITLTYKNNPYFLIKRHLQLFIKRLRKKIKKKIRYFACGEYGSWEHTHRPHFHIIIYGWKEKEKNLELGGYNKKGNKYYFSKTLNETWKYGRSTYQDFCIYEIPYIALYEQAKEDIRKDYKISLENAKKLYKELYITKKQPHSKDMIRTLSEYIKLAEKEKANYIRIKEFNTWSIALGWNYFEKQFNKDPERYDFKEYIEDKEFVTPSPWVIKLANNGYEIAIKEMLKRALELNSNISLEELKAKNLARALKKKKDKILEWVTTKEKIIL